MIFVIHLFIIIITIIFLNRFYLLSKKTSYAGECVWQGDQKSGTERILKDCGIATEEWQMGVTKAFIRHPETVTRKFFSLMISFLPSSFFFNTKHLFNLH